MRAPTLEEILAAMKRLGYRVFEKDLSLNLVGVRSSNARAGKFDDCICLFYQRNGGWVFHVYPATTDPGLYYLRHPLNRAGAAVLVPGQYLGVWAIDIHNGDYQALCQRLGPVKVFRDSDRDEDLDQVADSIQEGFFGINIHYDKASPGGSETVYKASAGCQVFKKKADFDFVMALAKESRGIYGNRFSYTLLTEADVFRDVKPAPQPDPAEDEEAALDEESIGWFILRKEGRFDSQGRLLVYKLPSGDGGGSFEIAGINDRYHPQKAAKLKELIEAGRHEEAALMAASYIEQYTMAAATWHPDVRVACFLRDCIFNRGAAGAGKILQRALVTAGTLKGSIDGKVGSLTKEAARRHAAEDLVFRLLLARQWYEREEVGRDESSKFWNGLVNRWVDAAHLALQIGDPYKFGA